MRLFGVVDASTYGVADRAWFLTLPFDVSISGADGSVGLGARIRAPLAAEFPPSNARPFGVVVRPGFGVEFDR